MDDQDTPAKILSVNEIVRERMIACGDKALAQFHDAVHPIYCSTEHGQPDQEGSCVLLEINGKRCLMTAGHVIDANRFSSLYVGGRELQLIECEFFTSHAPNGDRGKDRYDFAIAELSDDFIAKLGRARFLRDDDISRSVAPTSGHLYQCLGFPNSQNRRVDVAAKKITPRRGRYASNTIGKPALLKQLQISGADHLIIDHRKHSKDEKGNKVSSYALPGFSGGAVIDLGKISDPAVAAGMTPCEPRLAGLFIEYHKEHQAIVATRIDTILRAYLDARS